MRIVLSNGQVTVDPTSGNPATIAGETQIALRLAGVCETDLQLMAGYMAFDGVLGHEFIGEALSGPWVGRRVVGEINCACQQCRYCERGQQSHCPHRTVLGILKRDGAFATQFSLPQENLHLVPDDIPDEIAVLTEPVAAALRVAEQIDLTGKTVLVVGDGRLGSLCAATLHPLAKELSVAGKHPAKLEFVRNLGLATFFNDQLPEGRKWDVVIETTGRREGLAFALPLVEPEGTLVLKTTVAGPHELSLAPVVIDEIRVIGSRCGPFAKALVWLKSHGKSLLPLIEQTYPLAEGVAALENAQRPGTRKILLKP